MSAQDKPRAEVEPRRNALAAHRVLDVIRDAANAVRESSLATSGAG
jgi:hypothetical protein